MVAPTGKATLHSVAAALIHKAAADARGSGGVLGNLIGDAAGQVKEFNAAITKNSELQFKQLELQKKMQKLREVQQKLDKIEKDDNLKRRVNTEKMNDLMKKQAQRFRELSEEVDKNNKELNDNSKELGKLNKTSGMVSNGFKFLIAKAAGAITAVASFGSAIENLDKRAKFSATQIMNLGNVTNDYWGTLNNIRKGMGEWNKAINDASWSNAKLGISVDDTHEMFKTLSQDLKLNTADYQNMAQIVGDASQNIGFLSKVLMTDTASLTKATTDASAKFNKSTDDTMNDMAGMYDALHELSSANKNLKFSMGDMTKMVLESQASFQGYNFNLRQTAQAMGNVAAKAQQQGATYEMSMKAAQGLTDIIQGGKAPDWAKFVAGDKLLDQLKSVGKDAKIGTDEWVTELGKKMGFDPSTAAGKIQAKGLETLAKNYKKYGSLSAANMANELLAGTTAGNEEMFKLLKQYGSGNEGRELLKRVWGLDDAAATAATLAMETADSYDQLTGIRDSAKKDAETRKPPSVSDLKSQTQEYVQAVASAQEGIVGTLGKMFGSLIQNPAITAILGSLGSATSGILQLVQTGAMMGMAGQSGALGAVGGAAGKVGAVAGQGAAVLAAGAAGYALGTAMVEASKSVEEWTGGAIPAMDKWLTGIVDLHTKAADTITEALGGMTDAQEEAANRFAKSLEMDANRMTRAIGGLNGNLDQGSRDLLVFGKTLDGVSTEELEGIAKSMVAAGKITKKKAGGRTESDDEAVQRVKENLEKAQAAGKAAPAVGTPEYAALFPDSATPKTAAAVTAEDMKGGKSGTSAASKAGPPVIAVTHLTKEQKAAVSVQVATSLTPEVKGMASSMFDGMAKQATEYNTSQIQAGAAFWADMVKSGQAAWNDITKQFQQQMGGTSMIALTPEGQAAGGDKGKKGGKQGPSMGVGASVGPDGTIHINFSIPRHLLDKSNRQTDEKSTQGG